MSLTISNTINLTTTTIQIVVNSFGSGSQPDTFTIYVVDATSASTYTYTGITPWPQVAGVAAIFNWSSFSGTPALNDSFSVYIVDTTKSLTSNTVYGLIMPGPVSCFLASSRLLTPSGYRFAKDIRTGEYAITSDGRKVPVKRYVYIINKTTEEDAPYIILKDSFKEKYPFEDIRLSPNHAIEIKPGFWQIPKYLNAKQYDIGVPVTYYHFEAPNYLKDNFICSGAVVESYAAHQLDSITSSIYTYDEDAKANTRLDFPI